MTTLTLETVLTAAQECEARRNRCIQSALQYEHSGLWYALMLEKAARFNEQGSYLYFVAECIEAGEVWYVFEAQS